MMESADTGEGLALVPSMHQPKRQRLRDDPDLVEGFQVWKASCLHLMEKYGVSTTTLDQEEVKHACQLCGDYTIDDAERITLRIDS